MSNLRLTSATRLWNAYSGDLSLPASVTSELARTEQDHACSKEAIYVAFVTQNQYNGRLCSEGNIELACRSPF
jgi:hypothetical protein